MSNDAPVTPTKSFGMRPMPGKPGAHVSASVNADFSSRARRPPWDIGSSARLEHRDGEGARERLDEPRAGERTQRRDVHRADVVAARAQLGDGVEERVADGAHADEHQRRLAERDPVEHVVTSTRDVRVLAKRAAERERHALGERAIADRRERRMRRIVTRLHARRGADECLTRARLGKSDHRVRAADAELAVTVRMDDQERDARVLRGAPRDQREVERVLRARRAEDAPTDVAQRGELFAAVTRDGVRDDRETCLRDPSDRIARSRERLGTSDDGDALPFLGAVTRIREERFGRGARAFCSLGLPVPSTRLPIVFSATAIAADASLNSNRAWAGCAPRPEADESAGDSPVRSSSSCMTRTMREADAVRKSGRAGAVARRDAARRTAMQSAALVRRRRQRLETRRRHGARGRERFCSVRWGHRHRDRRGARRAASPRYFGRRPRRERARSRCR